MEQQVGPIVIQAHSPGGCRQQLPPGVFDLLTRPNRMCHLGPHAYPQMKCFMFRLFKTKRLNVNSYHHQGVKTLAARFHAVAWTDDGLVEAFEDDSGKVAGVQFHPEKERALDPAFNSVFKEFVLQAAHARKSRSGPQ